jgi:SNF2 family DNA or RNA helicase
MWLHNNHLVYEQPDPARFLKVVPGAISVDARHVAAPINLHSLQVIRYLGLPVPPPMDNYDWPLHGFDPDGTPWRPRDHQVKMANFMVLHPRCFNLSAMGSQKTLSALWATDYLMRLYPGTKCLIVAPLSTLQRVWADAIFTHFLGRRTARVLHGTGEKRQEALASPADFYIVNFDGLGIGAPGSAGAAPRGLYADLLDRSDIRIAIVDEASAYKDAGTKRHKIARKLLAPKDYLWLMTGTPTANGPLDAYGQARLLNNAWGETFTSYKMRVMYRVSQFRWIPKAGAQAEARKLLSPAIRFSIEDCVDLPPCTTQMRDVEFSPEQAKAYKEMQRDLRLQIAGKTITAVNEAVLRWKLIQISCGAIYSGDREVHKVDAAPRLAALREVLEQCNEKVIIMAPLTSVVNLLNKELTEYTRVVVNGEVSHKARSEIFRAFQEDEHPRLLIADPGTMAHGLTLTAASTVVWYAPTDKTEIYLQANKRIDRPGQTKNTTVVQLASTPTEREIFHRLERNETLQGVVLRMVRDGN